MTTIRPHKNILQTICEDYSEVFGGNPILFYDRAAPPGTLILYCTDHYVSATETNKRNLLRKLFESLNLKEIQIRDVTRKIIGIVDHYLLKLQKEDLSWVTYSTNPKKDRIIEFKTRS